MILVAITSDHDYEEYWIKEENMTYVRNMLNSLPDPLEEMKDAHL